MEPFQLEKAENGVWYFSIPEFEKYGDVKTFFTTRVGGVSEGDFTSLNFGGYTSDRPESVQENRRRVYEANGIGEDMTEGFVRQVHGDHVCCIQSEDILQEDTFTINNADGITTNLDNMLLMTLHADCLPLYFYDTKKKVIAVTHAGWRGTLKNIGPKTIVKMNREFGSEPEDIIAAIGPGISLCCFEVGPEVYDEFKNVFHLIDECSYRKENGKYMLDLKKINEIQLKEAGVSKVLVSKYCTKCDDELFFSHRRDNGHTGRMGAGIILKK
ncbi:MAG: peptidoglycan editing factor PgeF [Firmicutes bacterium]|nr:peptidoglycan editing factor PgeF [Bacillota bacterium]